MHSSGLHTVRCSGRLGGGGGVCLGGVCLGGSLVSAWGASGVCMGGVCLGGCPVSAWGVSARGVVHLPLDRMTDACENITFRKLLLRTVIKQNMLNMMTNANTISKYVSICHGDEDHRLTASLSPHELKIPSLKDCG